MFKSASNINKITTFIALVRRYDRCMKQYILTIFPADFKKYPAFRRAFVLGLVMMSLALMQLFQFEDFPHVVGLMQIPGGVAVAWVLAAILPLLEIASLPYLFSLKQPKRLRVASKWLGVAAALLLLVMTTWTSITMGSAVQSGVFGATIVTPSGWWSVLFAMLLLWSMWLTIRELPRRHS